nr:NADP-dependent oxidoreductase [Lichenifustis flavocetrariae]
MGSAACQIAKAAGATVIGSAGGAEKCAFLREIGVDQVVDYKVEKNLAAALAAAAPQGIDAYFDNVGGVHLDAALQSAKPFARFALCGMISQYNQIEGTAIQHMRLVVTKRLRLQGFIVSDDFDMMPQFVDLMAGWVASGAVKIHQTVEHGIENAPAAFLKLFSGGNIGKMLVRVST